jgi:hypothetical protein
LRGHSKVGIDAVSGAEVLRKSFSGTKDVNRYGSAYVGIHHIDLAAILGMHKALPEKSLRLK